MMANEKCTSEIMRGLLREKFSDHRRYALAEEVGNQTGYQRRRLDMVVVDVYASNGYSMEGIEIKVSKSDLRTELRDPSKHNIFFDDLDFYSLAAPQGVIEKDIIPKHWGIYSASFKDGEWKLRTVRRPLGLHDKGDTKVSRPFFACLARALSCQSPNKQALLNEYQKGREAGIEGERLRAGRLVREAEKNLEHLKEYEELYKECALWGAGSIEKGIAQFNAFRKMNLELFNSRLETLIDRATRIHDSLPQIAEKENG